LNCFNVFNVAMALVLTKKHIAKGFALKMDLKQILRKLYLDVFLTFHEEQGVKKAGKV